MTTTEWYEGNNNEKGLNNEIIGFSFFFFLLSFLTNIVTIGLFYFYHDETTMTGRERGKDDEKGPNDENKTIAKSQPSLPPSRSRTHGAY